MAREKLLTAAEWALMEPLWAGAPKTMMELVDAVEKEQNWSKSTVATMLSRMEEKGLVRYETEGRTRRYFPCIAREDAAARETASLLQRAYHGSLGLLVSTMVEKSTVSRRELEELYAILQKAEAEEAEKK